MATKEDAITLNILQKMEKHLRDNHAQVELEMADGVDIYCRAIKTVRNAGIWAVDIGILGAVIIIIDILNHPSEYFGNPYLSIGFVIAIMLFAGHLALKLYYFKVTPGMALFILLIMVPIEAFALPLWGIPIVAIPIISALFKWSTYKSWYNDMRELVVIEMRKGD